MVSLRLPGYLIFYSYKSSQAKLTKLKTILKTHLPLKHSLSIKVAKELLIYLLRIHFLSNLFTYSLPIHENPRMKNKSLLAENKCSFT